MVLSQENRIALAPAASMKARAESHILRIPGLSDLILVPGSLVATKFARSRPVTARKAVWLASQRRNSRLCHDQGAAVPSSPAASTASSRSCWRWQCAQPGDQRQNVGEHLS